MKSLIEKYKENKLEFLFLIALVGCLLCQLFITLYFNVFEAKEHMGIDVSWEYLKANIAFKERAFYPSDVINTTTQPMFERHILILPFYLIFKNVFVAYGLSSFFITVACLVVLYKIGTSLKLTFGQKLIILNLFICPFMANGFNIDNDLGYFVCVNGFGAMQNVSTLTILMVILSVVFDGNSKHKKIIEIATLALIVFIGVSKGTSLLVWIGVPMAIYIVTQVFIKNDIKFLISKTSIFMYASVVGVLLGRIIGGILGYQYLDSSVTWANASEIMKNLGNVLVGVPLLLGGIPGEGVERSPMSFIGLVYCFGLIMSIVLVVAILYFTVQTIKAIIKEKSADDRVLFLLVVFFANIAVYAFLVPYHVGATFEIRYLIPAIHSGFVLIGLFIKEIDDSLIIKKFGCVMLLISVIAMDLYSDYFLAITDNSQWQTDQLLAAIDDTDAGLVYFWDEEKYLVRPERVIRVIDSSRVYKSISYGNVLENFGDYKYYDDSKQYVGATVLVTVAGQEPLEKAIMEQYELLENIGDYSVYYCSENPIDLESMTIKNKEL
ncbi:hypothetical protein SAMN04487829_1889 [Pseudobutyrivibrio sp. NOR37]|uniref:Glycosyltransferase RgtA/B/C/D-like domain-containing protein n=1 Tax=Pseudobutyrivibrio xylanivorans TaxID=185007 RepID=A0A6M0LK84_PSEXY|nr:MULTISPECIES: hypothetical protein [Pseudobutyrivibrio]NEX02267.1 hypothetical protein [Pseudobutyrivibrio xylanivorans]SFR77559.1 hypothetical protein SAMN04487829_1889 [Pseudobutyrivibrio sp. NOR37]